ncbi:PilZ domain-containing protein [Ectothiorhodospira lacustris]|uniref:PilZ domain-containing protein n=1 Tax=Ectothiorhodospira lacustris TaxID=2899127 RepID=UPI001EE99A03|nr:PilZ domain-containing protein [Ectothiorhodospira lacustris]MCG5499533.1 PilZ domain-containing protein [Ectothiorhodospira lacustris]MCG5511111.1 PilZ domain-containing protein [Ectothiorhodospira lacustris]MCG5522882.1 PilZ domain-containing protein [Ectothiorhodospira lacustris]
MTTDDPFKDVLVIRDRLPLAVEPVAGIPPAEELARINEANESLLRVCAGMDDVQPRRTDDAGEVSQELLRIESKVNLLVEMVSLLLHAHARIPPPVPVRISAEGLGWAQPEAQQPGQILCLSFYLCPQFPKPLTLFARVASCESAASGHELSVLFQGMSSALEDGIQKMVFRRHRRSIALTRSRRDSEAG